MLRNVLGWAFAALLQEAGKQREGGESVIHHYVIDKSNCECESNLNCLTCLLIGVCVGWVCATASGCIFARVRVSSQIVASAQYAQGSPSGDCGSDREAESRTEDISEVSFKSTILSRTVSDGIGVRARYLCDDPGLAIVSDGSQ